MRAGITCQVTTTSWLGAGGHSSGQVGHVLPDVHEVLVHAPWVLGGDWDGNSMLLQVRGDTGKV